MAQPEILVSIALVIAACFVFFVTACLVTAILIVILTGSTVGLRDFAKVIAAVGRVVRFWFRFGS
ncbi:MULTISPECIES: hypothetical protein [unclassified Rhodococcus (in: high G+C Gram-positive bacteria)]|uniref:hypothetical protein n=1 Tax=unclassified Rhodococcus (in: high G+C Gram-positive bacteria) TaxID=192944 RepID=UPI00163985DE|nr:MULTISPECIES: hypothetical protein [unclassified Rhodococcus (in: high G+C Gram-positive bacteria)]MBC2644360.1 hypothetical protein [Rhodococcus sp. 3A]MBC2897948.1 hypothetical protein [Rhodococcus sp. 4CII]